MSYPPAYPGQPGQPGHPGHPVPQPQPGSCRNCGGFITIENDTACIVIVIVLSIVCFPFGLFGLCCLEKRARCMQCGADGGPVN